MIEIDGTKRAVIDHVGPRVDCGRFPVKRAAGESVQVVAHAFTDGHDRTRVEVRQRKSESQEWTVHEMVPDINDEWPGRFVVTEPGGYVYTVRAWVDPFRTWQDDLRTDDKYIWQGETNYVELEPRVMPARILRVQKRLRWETDIDYFM
jgi:starch synthase (maltosyl-transferring)